MIPCLSLAGKAKSPMKLLFLGAQFTTNSSFSEQISLWWQRSQTSWSEESTHKNISIKFPFLDPLQRPESQPRGQRPETQLLWQSLNLGVVFVLGINNSYEMIYSGFQKIENRLLRKTTFLDSKPSHLSTNVVLQGPGQDQAFTFWGKKI